MNNSINGDDNKKSNNILPWFVAFISLLTALGGPTIFPDLVKKYLEKLNPKEFPKTSTPGTGSTGCEEENKRLKEKVVEQEKRIKEIETSGVDTLTEGFREQEHDNFKVVLRQIKSNKSDGSLEVFFTLYNMGNETTTARLENYNTKATIAGDIYSAAVASIAGQSQRGTGAQTQPQNAHPKVGLACKYRFEGTPNAKEVDVIDLSVNSNLYTFTKTSINQ